MPRIARIVVPNYPHHITQRGNRRQPVFFNDGDYQIYINLMAEWCAHFKVEIWAYCLMPNHTHLIAVPSDETGLRMAIGEAHRRYTRHINIREGWKGHLWQERFASFPMDERYLLVSTRYVELNPVRANLVKKPEDYRWSSAIAHIKNKDDILVRVSGVGEIVKDWNDFLSEPVKKEMEDKLMIHSSTGRPIGNGEFLKKLETDFSIPAQSLIKGKPGPRSQK